MTLSDRVLTISAQVLAAPSSPRQLAARAVIFGIVYLLGAWLAIGSRLPGSSMSLVWPSAGLGAIWILTANRRSLPWDAAALLSVAALTVVVSDGPLTHAVAHPTVALLAALVMRWVVRRWSPGVTTPLEGDAVRRFPTFVVVAVAAATAALVEAAGAPALLMLLGGEGDWTVLQHRWSRSWTIVFVATSTWLLGLASLGRRVGPEEERRRRSYGLPAQRRRGVEVAGLLALTAAVLATSLMLLPDLPISFALFVPAAWVGVRFSSFSGAVYTVTTGLVTVSATLAGRGIYADVDSALLAAFLVQMYMVILFTTVLILSLTSSRLRRAEQQAQSRAELLDRVLAGATDGVLLVDASHRVVLTNRAARRLLDLADAGTGSRLTHVRQLGLDRLVLADGSRRPPEESPLQQALRGRVVVHEDLLLPGEDGVPDRVLRFSAHAITGQQDPQALATFSDVTTEHAQTGALQAFAGEVAHDLKNPLAVVEGWSEILEGELLDSGQLSAAQGLPMVRRVQESARAMRSLIDELLVYAVARGHVLQLEQVDLTRVVDQVVSRQALTPTDAAPGLRPVVDVHTPHPVRADPVLVRQLLDNLIGNAVKYVPASTVPHVRVTTRPEGEYVRVDVSDNGLGVPPEHRRRIFESLYRIDRPGYSGTGLGLAISARIVERHGGTLTVDDGPDGIGSTFSFTLPAAPS